MTQNPEHMLYRPVIQRQFAFRPENVMKRPAEHGAADSGPGLTYER